MTFGLLKSWFSKNQLVEIFFYCIYISMNYCTVFSHVFFFPWTTYYFPVNYVLFPCELRTISLWTTYYFPVNYVLLPRELRTISPWTTYYFPVNYVLNPMYYVLFSFYVTGMTSGKTTVSNCTMYHVHLLGETILKNTLGDRIWWPFFAGGLQADINYTVQRISQRFVIRGLFMLYVVSASTVLYQWRYKKEKVKATKFVLSLAF